MNFLQETWPEQGEKEKCTNNIKKNAKIKLTFCHAGII